MLAVIMVTGVAPLSAFAEETVSLDLLTFELNEEEAEYSITACDKSASGSLVIPSTLRVTSIGDYAFSGCDSLTSVTIPDSVTSIGDHAFSGCDSLTSITVDANNKYYSSADGVLFNKNKTALIQYPIGNTRTSYTIPNSVTSIGNCAFNCCHSLTSVTIPNSVTNIGANAFYNCTSLTSVTIPDGVQSIGEWAFDACISLTSVTIPDSVTSIGDHAFSGCTSLTNITVDVNNKYYSSADGVLLNKDKTELIQYPIGNTRTSYTIPNSVTSIGNCAFSDCYSLTNVTIPDSVTSIGDSAFNCCHSLTNVTIPDSVTSIGDSAFYYCASLTSVTIPDGVHSIGDYAFSGCISLTRVTIPDSVTSIGDAAFYYCESLTDVYYTGTEEEWKSIKIYDGNDPLLNATIHYNWTGEMPHVHTLQTIENPATCTVNGIRYQQCINCGEQIGEATILPALGHSWGEWKEITPATTEAEGVEERACSVCGEKETRAIPRLAQTVKDASSGIEISAPSGAYKGTLELEIEEVFDGESYNVVSTIDGAAQNKVYDITTKVDGEPAQPGKAVTVRIPLPEGYDPDRTYVYHVNSETGEVENMNARYEDGCLVFETDHFSVYAVVEMEEERSFFGKVIDVLLGIVSLPVKLIVGLFKLIIGLFK